MLPFTTQIIEVVSAHYPPNLPTPGDAVAAAIEEAASPRSAAPVADPATGHAQVDSNNAQLAQQTAFPGLQVSLSHGHLMLQGSADWHAPIIKCCMPLAFAELIMLQNRAQQLYPGVSDCHDWLYRLILDHI